VSRLGSFLGTVGRTGIDNALRSFDLASFVGRSAEEIFVAMANALAPEGALVEDAAARVAVDETLAALYDKVIANGGDLGVLDSLTGVELAEAVETCIATYIYERWIGELGKSIERGAVSADAAVSLEQGMKAYVRESVKLKVGGKDVIQIDWAGAEGQALIETVFQDAYSFLERNS
jgi:hypothetical protein